MTYLERGRQMKVKMKKKFKYPLIAIGIIMVVIVGLIGFKTFFKSDISEVKVIDTIGDYSYTLDERDTEYMKSVYNELKSVLKEKDIDEEKYATLLAKLFVTDLFTLDNKINKYDVACLEYVYPDNLENFKLNVENTLYKIVKDNTYGKRNQDLPVVKSVDVVDTKEDSFLLAEEEVSSYVVSLNIEYEHDLGYDKEATVTVIKSDKKMYVVEYKGEIVNEEVE